MLSSFRILNCPPTLSQILSVLCTPCTAKAQQWVNCAVEFVAAHFVIPEIGDRQKEPVHTLFSGGVCAAKNYRERYSNVYVEPGETSSNHSVSSSRIGSVHILDGAFEKGGRRAVEQARANREMHSLHGNTSNEKKKDKKEKYTKKEVKAFRNAQLKDQKKILNELREEGNAKAMTLKRSAIKGKGDYKIGRVMKGRGDYSLGEQVGGKIGSFLGGKMHAFLQRIFGSGDYSVSQAPGEFKQNSILGAGSIPRMHSTAEGGVKISFHEYCFDIGVTAGLQIKSEPISVTNPRLFPFLHKIAGLFQQVRFDGLCFVIKSLSSNAVVAPVQGLANMGASIRYDNNSPPPTTTTEVLNSYMSEAYAITQSFIVGAECATGMNQFSLLNILAPGQVPTNLQLYQLGILDWFATGGPNPYEKAAQFWVTYEVELIKPRITVGGGGATLMLDLMCNDRALPLKPVSDTTLVTQPRINTIGATLAGDRASIIFPLTLPTDSVWLINYVYYQAETPNIPILSASASGGLVAASVFNNQNTYQQKAPFNQTNTGCSGASNVFAFKYNGTGTQASPPRIYFTMTAAAMTAMGGTLLIVQIPQNTATGLTTEVTGVYTREEFFMYLCDVVAGRNSKFAGPPRASEGCSRIVDWTQLFMRVDRWIVNNPVPSSGATFDITFSEAMAQMAKYVDVSTIKLEGKDEKIELGDRLRVGRSQTRDDDRRPLSEDMDYIDCRRRVRSPLNGTHGSYTNTDDHWYNEEEDPERMGPDVQMEEEPEGPDVPEDMDELKRNLGYTLSSVYCRICDTFEELDEYCPLDIARGIHITVRDKEERERVGALYRLHTQPQPESHVTAQTTFCGLCETFVALVPRHVCHTLIHINGAQGEYTGTDDLPPMESSAACVHARACNRTTHYHRIKKPRTAADKRIEEKKEKRTESRIKIEVCEKETPITCAEEEHFHPEADHENRKGGAANGTASITRELLALAAERAAESAIVEKDVEIMKKEADKGEDDIYEKHIEREEKKSYAKVVETATNITSDKKLNGKAVPHDIYGYALDAGKTVKYLSRDLSNIGKRRFTTLSRLGLASYFQHGLLDGMQIGPGPRIDWPFIALTDDGIDFSEDMVAKGLLSYCKKTEQSAVDTYSDVKMNSNAVPVRNIRDPNISSSSTDTYTPSKSYEDTSEEEDSEDDNTSEPDHTATKECKENTKEKGGKRMREEVKESKEEKDTDGKEEKGSVPEDFEWDDDDPMPEIWDSIPEAPTPPIEGVPGLVRRQRTEVALKFATWKPPPVTAAQLMQRAVAAADPLSASFWMDRLSARQKKNLVAKRARVLDKLLPPPIAPPVGFVMPAAQPVFVVGQGWNVPGVMGLAMIAANRKFRTEVRNIYSTLGPGEHKRSLVDRIIRCVKTNLPFSHLESAYIINDCKDGLALDEIGKYSDSKIDAWRFGTRNGDRKPYSLQFNEANAHYISAGFKGYRHIPIFVELFERLVNGKDQALVRLNYRSVVYLDDATKKTAVRSTFIEAARKVLFEMDDISEYNQISRAMVVDTLIYYVQQKLVEGTIYSTSLPIRSEVDFGRRARSTKSRRTWARTELGLANAELTNHTVITVTS